MRALCSLLLLGVLCGCGAATPDRSLRATTPAVENAQVLRPGVVVEHDTTDRSARGHWCETAIAADPAFEYYQLSVLRGTSCAVAIKVFKALAIQVLGRDSQRCYAGYCAGDPKPTTVLGYRCTGEQVGDVSVTYDIVCRRGGRVVAAYSTEPGG
jgi:hypothetical protein